MCGQGGPNLIERIEGGLLSYGNDMTSDNSPHGMRVGQVLSTPASWPSAVSAGCAMREELEAGSARMIRAIEIGGSPVPGCDRPWPLRAGDEVVGQVTSAAWSPDFDTNVAIGMVDRAYWDAGRELSVETQGGTRAARVRTGSGIDDEQGQLPVPACFGIR